MRAAKNIVESVLYRCLGQRRKKGRNKKKTQNKKDWLGTVMVNDSLCPTALLPVFLSYSTSSRAANPKRVLYIEQKEEFLSVCRGQGLSKGRLGA